MLGGNLVALGSSFIIMQIQMLTKPDNYDWKSMGEIKLLEDDRSGLSADDLDPEELLKAKRWIETGCSNCTFGSGAT